MGVWFQNFNHDFGEKAQNYALLTKLPRITLINTAFKDSV